MYRKENTQTMTLFRSFLVNKIPPFLALVSANSLAPLQAEMYISQAFARLDPNAFPSFSQMFDTTRGNSTLSEVRPEFLFACALHQLIPEDSIERLLGEMPMQTLPSGGRLLKNDVADQITANPEKADQLLTRMENMDGNAGAIAKAFTDVGLIC